MTMALYAFSQRQMLESFRVKGRLSSDIFGPVNDKESRGAIYPAMKQYSVTLMGPTDSSALPPRRSFLDADIPPPACILRYHTALGRAALAARRMPQLERMMCFRDDVNRVSYDPETMTLDGGWGTRVLVIPPNVKAAWQETLQCHHPGEDVKLKLHKLVVSKADGSK